MNLASLLAEKKKPIVKKWFDAIIKSYPVDSRRFFKKEKNQFANPVGQSILEGINALFEALIVGEAVENFAQGLDNIIKIRAVQDFKPSEAIAFVLQFKDIVREFVKESGSENGYSGELQALDKKIDEIALLAFDIYSQRRKKIYDLRVNEIQRQVSRLLTRANLVCEIPDKITDP